MQRYHFRGQCRPGIEPERYFAGLLPELQRRMKARGARELSLFQWGNQLFLYYESIQKQVNPHDLFAHAGEALEAWPGEDAPRQWVPMMDIFHYQQPAGPEHWQRRSPPGTPYARLARLRPGEVSSYIFYHYQYQEEKPGDGDKYGIIILHENLMFFYSERPATMEPAPYSGKLATAHTPADWAGVMKPHFIMWDEDAGNTLIWLEIPRILQA